MSDNKLVKLLLDAATITGLVAGIGWIGRKIIKEDLTKDPSANAMNYVCPMYSGSGFSVSAMETEMGTCSLSYKRSRVGRATLLVS